MFVIVMGVTGSGKSTVAELLAARLGLQFHDADDYHSPENRAKMAANVALDDADRWPWLEHLAALALSWEAQGGAVLACSALKQAHRETLVQHVPQQCVVYLQLPRAVAERRLEKRRGQHEFVRDFDRLLDGQYRDLEPPSDAISVSAELSPEAIVEHIVSVLDAR